MRADILLGAILGGLALCGTASAQNTSNLYKNYASNATSSTLYDQNYGGSISNSTRQTSTGNLASRTMSNSRFSLRDLFTRVQSPSIRPDFATAAVPDPSNSEAYLKAFGFKRLGTRR